MNIGIFTSSYLPVLGGLQFELYWLLKSIDRKFKARGIERFIFMLPEYKDQKYLGFENIEVVEFKHMAGRKGAISIIPELARISKEYSISLLNCHAAVPDGFSCMGARLLSRVPYIVTAHGVDVAVDRRFNYGSRLKPLTNLAVRMVLKQACRVTTISSDMADFAEDAGADRGKLHIIPDGIELNRPSSQAGLEQKIRQEYAISDSHTVYLTLSGMRKIKGHENLVKAFALALKKNGRLLLFIGAHGHETENIKALVKELGIGGNVHFIGFVTGADKAAWFNVAHVYCNTAFFEPFGIVYIESVLHGLAVLGTKHGGARDIFHHGRDAHIVDPESIDEITSGILALSDPEYRNKVITNAGSLLPLYDIETIADRYLDIYTSCLSR